MYGRSTLISHSKSVKHKKWQDEEKRSVIIASTIAMYFSSPKKGDAATKMVFEPIVEQVLDATMPASTSSLLYKKQ